MFLERIGEAAVYEGIAEEAAELAAASSKMARILREDNPTPVGAEEGRGKVIEELTHVLVYCADIALFPNSLIADHVRERFLQRWEYEGES